jgi:ABC-type transport system substrate-binding protein
VTIDWVVGLAALLAATALAAAVACSAPAPLPVTPAATSGASAVAAPAPTVMKAASGGTLVFGGGQDTQSFNIILFPKSMCSCNSLIYSTLFKLNATGTDVEGDLVERGKSSRVSRWD